MIALSTALNCSRMVGNPRPSGYLNGGYTLNIGGRK